MLPGGNDVTQSRAVGGEVQNWLFLAQGANDITQSRAVSGEDKHGLFFSSGRFYCCSVREKIPKFSALRARSFNTNGAGESTRPLSSELATSGFKDLSPSFDSGWDQNVQTQKSQISN